MTLFIDFFIAIVFKAINFLRNFFLELFISLECKHNKLVYGVKNKFH